jgi:hypothetical protein
MLLSRVENKTEKLKKVKHKALSLLLLIEKRNRKQGYL